MAGEIISSDLIEMPSEETKLARKHPCALCEKCTLRDPDNKYVGASIPQGKEAQLVVVGEAPGYDELKSGKPFTGQAGGLLRASIRKAGVNPDEVLYTNVIACRPPSYRPPTPDEIAACKPRLDNDLAHAAKDASVLALGKVVHDSMFGDEGKNITSLRGTWKPLKPYKGVMVAHPPSYVIFKPSELESFLADVQRAVDPPTKVGRPEVNIVIIDDVKMLEAWIAVMHHEVKPPILCFDIETDNLQWYEKEDAPSDRILMLAIAWSENEVAIIPYRMLYKEPAVKTLLNVVFEEFETVGHNAKFDVVYLRAQLGIKAKATHDTMLMHYTLNELGGTHGLKLLAKTYLGMDDYEEELIHKYLNNRNDRYSKVPFDKMAEYAAIDVCSTLRLYHIFRKQLEDKNMYSWPYMSLLMRASEGLAQVELNGAYIDVNYLKAWKVEMEADLEALLAEITKVAGFPLNPNSPTQLKKYLYDTLHLPRPPQTRKSKEGSTDVNALNGLKGKHPIVGLLLTYRRTSKILSSYVKNLLGYADVNGRVHATFLIHGTETGRLSARDPALQTIPRESRDELGARIRGCFTAPPGHKLVIVDYSQAELRALAALSGEPFLLRVYAEGRDLHTEAAVALFGENYTKENRIWTKMLNFSYAYGGNENSFAEGTGMHIEQAREIVRKYDQNMPVAKKWKLSMLEFAKKHGYVQSIFGRRRRFPIISPKDIDEVRKAAVNMPVQSCASDLTLTAMCNLLDMGYKVVLQVHDSLIIECRDEDAQATMDVAVNEMVKVAQHLLPQVAWKADGEIATRWGQKEKVVLEALIDNLPTNDVEEVNELTE